MFDITKLSKILISMALIVVVPASVFAETEISGFADVDMGVYFDKDFDYDTKANHEVGLDLTTSLNEGFTLEVALLMYSTMVDTSGERMQSFVRRRDRGALVNDDESLYPSVALDGVRAVWEFTENGSFVFGDLGYSHGQTSYYGFTHSSEYGAILPDQFLRGIGFEVADGKFYLGAPSSGGRDHGIVFYASYATPLITRNDEKLVVTPVFDFMLSGNPRSHRHTIGAEVEYTKSLDKLNYGTYAAMGLIPHAGENSWTFLVEPSMSYGLFNLGVVGYHAALAFDDKTAEHQTYMPEQQFLVVEPGFAPHPKLNIGLPVEYHDPSLNVDEDDYLRFGPAAYLYPTPGAEITFWTAYDVMHNAPNLFSLGIAASTSF